MILRLAFAVAYMIVISVSEILEKDSGSLYTTTQILRMTPEPSSTVDEDFLQILYKVSQLRINIIDDNES